MKWSLTLVFTLLVAGIAVAAGPDDQYVTVYDLIQQGDTLNKSGQLPLAAEKYQEAQAQLKQLQTVSPNWNTDVVTFRLNYLAEKLQELKKYVHEKPTAPAETKPAAVEKPTQESLEQQVADLQNQVQQLNADKSKLEAKLKEALSAQPAAVDPQELAKANATIAALTKERDLLAVTLEQEKQKSQKGTKDADVASLRQQLAAALEELANAKKHAQQESAALKAEIAQLKQAKQDAEKNVAAASGVTPLNANEVEKFNALTKERDDLKKEQERLTRQLADAEASRDELQHKADNLSKQFADLQANNRAAANQPADTASKKGADVEGLEAKLVESEKSRADFKKQLDSVMKELADAEANRDQDVLAAHAETEKLRQQLVQGDAKRVELEKTLEQWRQLSGGGASGAAEKQALAQLKGNVQQLKDRLAVLEAKPIPYTQEELALFKKAGNQPTPAPKNVRSYKDLSDAARALIAEGDRSFRARDYPGAEAKFREALKVDPQNIYILAMIANIQMVAEQYDACETTLKQAFAVDPEDAGCLYLLGKLRLREDKVDDALDALSRSARINPTNAMTENALGNAFSRKGMRQPAENALRKALQIDPDLPEAHHNLALVYATDRPPSVELAKWHYKKATDGGYPKDTDLEKLLK